MNTGKLIKIKSVYCLELQRGQVVYKNNEKTTIKKIRIWGRIKKILHAREIPMEN